MHIRLILPVLAVAVSFPFSTFTVEPAERPSPIPLEAQTEAAIGAMSIGEQVGQLFIVDLRGTPEKPVTEVTPDVSAMIRSLHPGGILLFGANIDTVEQTRRLIADLQTASSYPLFIAVDYEGGEVSRLTSSGKIPATRIPSGKEIGATENAAIAYEIGKVIGEELGALGITMDLAPVADILTNPSSMVGSRSFSSDPASVASMAGAVVRGIQDTGVSSVAKHFPGHGDTTIDTHNGLAVSAHDLRRLQEIELVPFYRVIKEDVDGIMIAHIALPEIGGAGIPATFSHEIVTDLLRNSMRFEGLIVTDSLSMRAIRKSWSSREAAVAALLSGVDVVLQPFDAEAAIQGVLEAVRTGIISQERIEASLRRIIRTKLRRKRQQISPDDPQTGLGSPAHQAVVDQVR